MGNIFSKWKEGLSKSSKAAFGQIATLLGTSEVTPETWADLEALLIQADLGMDVEEGADILMVKPAMPYLDIISALEGEFDQPVAAFQVRGEYSMIKAAAQKGWLDEQAVMLESLTSIKRAGADLILTYFAKDAARIMTKQN